MYISKVVQCSYYTIFISNTVKIKFVISVYNVQVSIHVPCGSTQIHVQYSWCRDVCNIARVATVNWMWNSRTFSELSRPFLSKFSSLLNQKSIITLYIKSADLLLGKNQASVFVFIHCYTEGTCNVSSYDKQLIFIIFFIQVKTFAHSRVFKDRYPKSRTFWKGLEFSFANSRTYQDFQGPWQPCIIYIYY